MKINRCGVEFTCEQQDDCQFFLRDADAPCPVCDYCGVDGGCKSEDAIKHRLTLLARLYEVKP